jgi:crotonobetainyl-CoA hydratase
MTAAEAQSWGIVNEVATFDQLLPVARLLAERICDSAPLSVAAVLELIHSLEDVSTADAMPILRDNKAYQTAINSEDAQEGTTAHGEKRKPNWQGR